MEKQPMTIEPATPFASYTVSGIGPYAVAWPYFTGTLKIAVIVDGVPVELIPDDFTITPQSSEGTSDAYVTEAAAAIHDGRTLTITRQTPGQQGWVGAFAREKGLEYQLDYLTMAIQETRRAAGGGLRVDQAVDPIQLVAGATLVMTATGFAAGPSPGQIGLAAANAETAAGYVAQAEGFAETAGNVAVAAGNALTSINDKITVSVDDPTGGSEGDLWFKYTPI
jgi:hypothetical protein